MKAVLFAALVLTAFTGPAAAGSAIATSSAPAELTCEQINTEAAALSTRLAAEQKSKQSGKLENERKAGAEKKRRLLLGSFGSMLGSRRKAADPGAAAVSSDQARMDELLDLSTRKGC
jgi:hypothetical protein